MTLIKVKLIANSDINDATALRAAVVSTPSTNSKALTYHVADDTVVHKGDVVIVPCKHFRSDHEDTRIGVVTEIDTNTSVTALSYRVKDIIAKLTLTGDLAQRRVLAQRVDTFHAAAQRARLLDKMAHFKALAADDMRMRALLADLNVDNMTNDDLQKLLDALDD